MKKALSVEQEGQQVPEWVECDRRVLGALRRTKREKLKTRVRRLFAWAVPGKRLLLGMVTWAVPSKQLLLGMAVGAVIGIGAGKMFSAFGAGNGRYEGHYELREVRMRLGSEIVMAVKLNTATGNSWALTRSGWKSIPVVN